MRLYPIPKKIKEYNGEYYFSKNMVLTISKKYYDKGQIKLFVELFKNFTAGVGKLKVKVVDGLENTAVIAKTESTLNFASTNGEEYLINIDEKRAVLTFNDNIAFAHAFFTLLSMIEIRTPKNNCEVFTLPLVEISDTPSLQFRAIHICVFPQTNYFTLKKIIRFVSFCKYSHVILEFWGMYKYKCCKYLSWKNAYTKKQIQTLVAQANQMGVEIIPMLNCLGHASQSRSCCCKHVVLDQNPKLNYLFEPNGWTWNLLNPETKLLIKKMMAELVEVCGNGKYFMIGFDESFPYGSSRLFNGQDKVKIMYNFINELVVDLKKIGRRAIMWGDQLLWNPELPTFSNTCLAESEEIANTLLENIDKSVLIADWQYNARDKNEMWTSKHLSNAGFEVALAPWEEIEGLKVCVQNVFNHNYFGLIQTTWHIISLRPRMILHSGIYAWSGNIELTKTDEELLFFETAMYYRKLCPPKGVYKKAGIKEEEITI